MKINERKGGNEDDFSNARQASYHIGGDGHHLAKERIGGKAKCLYMFYC